MIYDYLDYLNNAECKVLIKRNTIENIIIDYVKVDN